MTSADLIELTVAQARKLADDIDAIDEEHHRRTARYELIGVLSRAIYGAALSERPNPHVSLSAASEHQNRPDTRPDEENAVTGRTGPATGILG